jgi:hypothetical protein
MNRLSLMVPRATLTRAIAVAGMLSPPRRRSDPFTATAALHGALEHPRGQPPRPAPRWSAAAPARCRHRRRPAQCRLCPHVERVITGMPGPVDNTLTVDFPGGSLAVSGGVTYDDGRGDYAGPADDSRCRPSPPEPRDWFGDEVFALVARVGRPFAVNSIAAASSSGPVPCAQHHRSPVSP